ncbi:MAG: diguanylate cyclase [Proteobacteria bacterium]|nr:MAG: diguanylate cyclase [Pseudomonadota bacterium]PIE18940.1 MAG: diguanylate cyclase [Pseudomonadota bacterium]
MTRLAARSVYYARRLLTERAGLILGAVTAWMLSTGQLYGVSRWSIALTLGLLFLFCLRLLGGWRARRTPIVAGLDRFELGLSLVALVHAGIQLAGGPSSWAQPLAYIAMAYLVGFNGRIVGGLLTATALAFQLALHLGEGALTAAAGASRWAALEWAALLTRGGYLLVFALANLLFLQAEVARRRRTHHARLTEAIRALHDEARDYRLISASLTSSESVDRAIDESKLMRGAVEAIHQGMFFVLDLLKKSLELQTCVLLWLDAQGRQLKIKELVTDSRLVTETAIPAQAGAIGGVVKNRLLLNLRARNHNSRGIAYYAGPEEVGAFLGVPVVEDGHLRGVLCADRRQDRPFSRAEEELMVEASRQVLRAIQSERVFVAVERSKYEHERFYRASTMLNGALTLTQVYDTAFAAAQQITAFDFAAITLYDRQARKHDIERVWGEEDSGLEGARFGNNAGLVSMVVKNKHFLPAGDPSRAERDRERAIFTRKLRVRQSIGSLVVLPLIVQDEAIGTFVFGAERPRRFPKRVREMLSVIANQVAVSVENAKMYKRMEEMATTDGLTGLPNHRTFQARLNEMLARAERHGKPVSICLTDVDKFKSVNDTYGHPVGDQVLKRVAKVLAQQVRKVDIVARYGGEEFAFVLEETDAAGAKLLCERVREEIAAQLMNSDKGTFRVTISLGIASYPRDGEHKQLLIERADQALYHAKESGRNRTVRFDEMTGALRKTG